MDHLRHQKHKNKRLENSFKPISLSANDMDKFEEKKELTKKRTFKMKKTLIMIGMIG